MKIRVYLFIITALLLFAACTSSITEPQNKKEYIEQYREFAQTVQDSKDIIDDDVWIKFKEKQDLLTGKSFIKFIEELNAKEIKEIGGFGRKVNKHIDEYKKKRNLLDPSLSGRDSVAIAKKIKEYHKNGQKEELSKFLDDAIKVGGEVKHFPKAVLFELNIHEEYQYKWGDNW